MADGDAENGQTPPPAESRPPGKVAPSWGAVSNWAVQSTVAALPDAEGGSSPRLDPWSLVDGDEPAEPEGPPAPEAAAGPISAEEDALSLDLDGGEFEVDLGFEAEDESAAADDPFAPTDELAIEVGDELVLDVSDLGASASSEDSQSELDEISAESADGAAAEAEAPSEVEVPVGPAEGVSAPPTAEADLADPEAFDAPEVAAPSRSGAESVGPEAGAADEGLDEIDAELIDEVDAEAEPAAAAPRPPPLPGVVNLGRVPAPAVTDAQREQHAAGRFGEGSPPALDPLFAEGAVQPVELPIATGAVASRHGHVQRLLRRLRQEVRLEADPIRRAALLLDFGVLAGEVLGDLDTARAALWAAWLDDPALAPVRWALDRVLARRGERETRLTLLMRGDAEALDRAGHVAMLPPADPPRALEAWGWAAEYAPEALGPMLSATLVRAATPGAPELAATLEWALARAQTGAFWDTLLLEHTRTVLDDPAAVGPRLSESVSQQAATPALLALTEWVADRDGDLALAMAAVDARGRRDAALLDGEARARLAVQRGWVLEREGRLPEALAQYALALEAPGVGQQRSLRLHAEQLASRVGDVAAAAPVLWEGDEAAVLQPAEDRARRAHRLGRMALAKGDVALARTAFEAALAAEPTHWPSLADLGRLLAADGDWLAAQSRAVDEIAAREAALAAETEPGRRAAAARSLLDRYYRLARLVETHLAAPDLALAYDKRALGLDARFAPALLAMERSLASRRSFTALAALYRGRADRAGEPAAQRPWLRAAADVLRVHLDRADTAGRLYARLLQEDAFDREALEGALACLERVGDPAGAAAAASRLADRADGPEAVEARLRAGLLHIRAGHGADALAVNARALEDAPTHPLALDGVARLLHHGPELADADAGGVDPTLTLAALANEALAEARARASLAPSALAPDGSHPDAPAFAEESLGRLTPLQVVTLAESMLANGHLHLAARWLAGHRRLRRTGSTQPLPAVVSAALTALELWVSEALGDWPTVVEATERRAAAAAAGPTRANLLARLGELAEFRLGDPARALAAYEQALDTWPACRAAREGFARLGPPVPVDHVGGPWWQRAAQARSVLERRHILEAEAAGLADVAEADALRTLAGSPVGDSIEARLARDELPDFTAAVPARRRTIAVARLAQAVAAGDDAELTAAIAELDALDPHSPLVSSARRRLARRQDDAEAARGALDALADRLGETLAGAAVRRAAATEATTHGADPARILDLLEAAVKASPEDTLRAQALAERLIAEGDWSRLAAIYRLRQAALPDAAERESVSRSLATLLAEQFDDAAGAAQALAPLLESEAVGLDTLLKMAEHAVRAGDHALADAAWRRAAQDPAAQVPVTIAQAQAMEVRGDAAAARTQLEALVAERPDALAAWEALAETLTRLKDWRALLRAQLQLLDLEPTDPGKALRALAVGHVLSRVLRDHRRAAGWYKRAIELDANRLDAVTRMLAEVEALGPDHDMGTHVADALDRAVAGQRARLLQNPTDADALAALFGLHGQRHDADAQWLVATIRLALGQAEGPLRAWVTAKGRTRATQFGAPLSDEARQRWLVDEREHGAAGAIFTAFAPALRTLFAGPQRPGELLGPGTGGPWHGPAQQIADDLGLGNVAFVFGPPPGTVGLDGGPWCALNARAAAPPSAVERFQLAAAIEAIREHRVLLLRGDDALATLAGAAMAMSARLGARFAEGGSKVAPNVAPEALAQAAAQVSVPRQHLEAMVARGESPPDFGRLVAGVRATGARAGLLVAGDPGLALVALVGGEPTPDELALALRTQPEAQALFHFALGAEHLALRAALGLAVSP